MKVFKDAGQREWKITVNVGTAKVVRDLTGVNIFDLFTDEAQRVFSDPCLLVDVLYALCHEQCRERGVSDVSFGESLVGDAIEDGANAMMEEVADFFPSHRRKLLRATMDKSKQVADQMTARAMAVLDKMDTAQLLKSTGSQGS